MDKFEADDQLAKWQQAFVQATPKVDSAALIAQTQKSRTKLKLKGLIDSFLGVVVTVFCIYAMLFEAKNTYDGTTKHNYDKSGDSKIMEAVYKLKSGGVIIISCYDWSDKLTSSKGWDDSLRISIRSKKFNKFLANAY